MNHFVQIQVASIACHLSNLLSFTDSANRLETVIRADEPFGLSVQVEFSQSGAIALLALQPKVQVDFFAKPLGAGQNLELGSIIEPTNMSQFAYIPTLKLADGPSGLGMKSEQIYKLTAVLRVGAIERSPAFIHGFIEGLTVQVYAT